MARNPLGQWDATHYVGTIKTVSFLILLVAACFALGGHARAAASASATASAGDACRMEPFAVAIILGLQAVVFTIDGWDGVVYVGGEVRNPGRDIPRAIFGSVFSVMGIYLLLNLAILYVLPMNEIAGNDFALGAGRRAHLWKVRRPASSGRSWSSPF